MKRLLFVLFVTIHAVSYGQPVSSACLMAKGMVNPYATYDGTSTATKGTNITLSGGNLTEVNTTSTSNCVIATIFKSSGKWYWEDYVTSYTLGTIMGIAKVGINTGSYLGADTCGYGIWSGSGGTIYHSGVPSAPCSGGFVVSGWIGHALDMDNGKYWVTDNTGVWKGFNAGVGTNGDPVAGTYPAVTGLTGAWGPAGGYQNENTTMNCGQSTFHFTPPSGFNALR